MTLSNGYFMVLFVALGSFTYGFNNSVIGSVLGLSSFLDYFEINNNSAKSNSIIGATSGLFAGGGAIGALISAWLANKVGRIRAMQATCVICMVSAAIQGGSVHIAMFLVGRFISGIGAGLMVTLVPIYQSEVSPAESRGRMVGHHGFLIVTGYAFAGWTGYGCFYSSSPAFQWRFEVSAQIIAPTLLLLGSAWLPESPRWLVEKDRESDALDILRSLHSSRGAADGDTQAQTELGQIRTQLSGDQEMAQSGGRWALITNGSYRQRLFCGCLVQFIGQSTGVLVINNFQVSLYNSLGLYDAMPLLLYAVYLSWAAGMNYVSTFIIDRVGRIRLMVIGLIGSIVAMICEAAIVAQFSGTSNRIGNGFGVFFLFLFVTFYGGRVDATTYVYSAEVFPTHIRGSGMGLSIFTQFCTTLLYTEVAPTAFSNIGWKYYLVFILVPALGAVIIWFTFPETMGMSLEDISRAFDDNTFVREHAQEDSDPFEKCSISHAESV